MRVLAPSMRADSGTRDQTKPAQNVPKRFTANVAAGQPSMRGGAKEANHCSNRGPRISEKTARANTPRHPKTANTTTNTWVTSPPPNPFTGMKTNSLDRSLFPGRIFGML